MNLLNQFLSKTSLPMTDLSTNQRMKLALAKGPSIPPPIDTLARRERERVEEVERIVATLRAESREYV